MKYRLDDVLELVFLCGEFKEEGVRPARSCLFDQLTLHSLACVCKKFEVLVKKLFESLRHLYTGKNWFDGKSARVILPDGVKIDRILIPLIITNVVSIDIVSETWESDGGFSDTIRSRRLLLPLWYSMKSKGQIRGSGTLKPEADLLNFITSGSKQELATLSCGSLWGMFLGTLGEQSFWSLRLRGNFHGGLSSLYGLCRISDDFDGTVNRPSRIRSIGASRGSSSSFRTAKEQWNICWWLYQQGVVKRNRNVQKLLALSQSQENSLYTITGETVDLLVGTVQGRLALSDEIITLDEVIQVYLMCGLGHVRELLTKKGLDYVRQGKATIRELMRIQKHSILRLLFENPSLINAQDVSTMVCPPEERYPMVKKVLGLKIGNVTPFTRSRLLRIPSLPLLQFVLSDAGRAGLSANLYSLDDLDAVLDNSSQQRQASVPKLLEVLLRSKAGIESLQAKLFTVPEAIRYIVNEEILSVLLSPQGLDSLRQGSIRIIDFSPIHSKKQALLMVSLGSRRNRENVYNGDKEAATSHTSSTHKIDKRYGEPGREREIRVHLVNKLMVETMCTREDALHALEKHEWHLNPALAEISGQSFHNVSTLSKSCSPLVVQAPVVSCANPTATASESSKRLLTVCTNTYPSDREESSPKRTCLIDSPNPPVRALVDRPDDFNLDADASPSGEAPTSEQLWVLLDFLKITNVKTEKYAVAMLRMCGWNLEAAVQTYFATKDAS